eukprot:gene6513-8951_t
MKSNSNSAVPSTEYRRKTNRNLLELDQLKANYKKCDQELEIAENRHESEKEKLNEIIKLVENARNRLSIAQEEIDATPLPEGAQPKARIQARDQLKLEVEQLEAALNAQKKSTSLSSEQFFASERNLFQCDRDIARFAKTIEETMEGVAIIAQFDKEKALRQSQAESRRLRRIQMQQTSFLEAKEAQDKELKDLKAKQNQTAKKLNIQAKSRMAKSNEKTRELVSKIADVNEAIVLDRTEAVLELKANMDAARDEVATLAEKHVKKIELAKQQLENAKEEMLSKGLNPYVEFRKKEINSADEIKEKKMKEDVETNKRELALRMEKEQQSLDKQEKLKLKAADYEKKHRAAQGRQVIEERNREFISKRTVGNVDILDPTGRAARVDPSQITDIADFSFGLGKSSRIPKEGVQRITEKMRNKLNVDSNNVGEYGRLINGLTKENQTLQESYSFVKPDDDSDDDNEDENKNAMGSFMDDMKAENDDLAPQPEDFVPVSNGEDFSGPGGKIPGLDKSSILVNYKNNEKEKDNLMKILMDENNQTKSQKMKDTSLTDTASKYTLKTLSKFEKDSLERAKDRHRDRIEYGIEQIAGGKIFKGEAAFVSKPKEIIFKDFDVNKIYKKQFTLTNVSYTFNSFKVLELNDNVIDFFTITYDKPGRMSAGVSCRLEILFKPEINEDIYTFIKLQTETGPVEIPLQCLIKRCAPKILTSSVDFENVIMGQKLQSVVKIVNTQALPTKFTITPIYDTNVDAAVSDDSKMILSSDENDNIKTIDNVAGKNQNEQQSQQINEDEIAVIGGIGNEAAINDAELSTRVASIMTQVWRQKKRENPQPLSTVMSTGFVDGYNSTTIDLVCAPLSLGEIEQKFLVTFENVNDLSKTKDENNDLITQNQYFATHVFGEEVPIYVAQEIIDFKCVLFDRIYRNKVVLKNRAKIAYKVTIKLANIFKKYVEISPSMAFIQPKGSQSINIKFTPTIDILDMIKHFTLPYEDFESSALIKLPIEFEIANQDLPVHFILQSMLTPSRLSLSTTSLDFGRVYVGQQLIKKMSISNHSMLPQKIAFVRLKKEFSISPNDGFAVLLPNESIEFDISFSPRSVINYTTDLLLKSSVNDSYMINVTAQGIEAPLEISHPVIHMHTTLPGESVIESTMLTNKTNTNQTFEIMTPSPMYTWITVSPKVVTLSPQQTCRVEIIYNPPMHIEQENPNEWIVKQKEVEESVFDEWVEEYDWVYGKSKYGNVQWVKPFAHKVDNSYNKHNGNNNVNNEIVDNNIAGDDGDINDAILDSSEHDGQVASKEGEAEEDPLASTLPVEEWGIVGTWNIPILIKQKKRKDPHLAINNANMLNKSNSSSIDGTISLEDSQHTLTFPSLKQNIFYPLFLTIHTVVMLPQIDSDVKLVDFGQISVGTRLLKTFKIFNKTNNIIKFKAMGLNSVGPFTLIRPIKRILPNEQRIVVVECLPLQPGLINEVLLICNADDEVGGHTLKVTLRVQGLKPSVELHGLSTPPPNWKQRDGILDFGNCLSQDYIIKKFTIKNKSSFAVEASISRIVGKGLPPSEVMEYIERTQSGMPIFSIRPERVKIAKGGSEEIEVTFRPDRSRFQPFREDINVQIGQTDEIMRVGIFGRSWPRQFFVTPVDPLDEPFLNSKYNMTSFIEDSLLSHANNSNNNEVSKRTVELRNDLSLSYPQSPDIVLEFPDAFAINIDPSSYSIIDPNNSTIAGGAKAPPVKPPAAKSNNNDTTAIVDANSFARQQTRKIMIGNVKISSFSTNKFILGNGSYEVVLSSDAKESGMFTLVNDKGVLSSSTDVTFSILCTMQKPRSLGGLFVGSWKIFQAEIIIKGGWIPAGGVDECRIPITLKTYVSL